MALGDEAEAGFDAEAHKRRLAPGAILVARDELQDPNFNSAVVLLCQYGEAGAYGLVLNRTAHMPLSEIFDAPPEGASSLEKNRRVYVGGPVQPTEMQVLHIGSPAAPGALSVAPDVHLGGAWNALEDILQRDPKYVRLFLGYSGWAAGQLEREVELGAWEVFELNVKKLLLGPEESWFGDADRFKRFLASF